MSDRFVEKVNRPIKKLAKKRKDIAARPAATKTQKTVKGAKVTGLAATQSLYWIIKYTLLTNQALRWGEDKLEYINVGTNKKGKYKKFPAFNRRFPSLSSHFYYYIMLAGLAVGGIKIADNVFSNSDSVKDKQEVVQETEEKIKKLDPKSKEFIDDCIAHENITSIGIVYTETYRENPKVQYKENVWTVDFGMTWSMDKNGNMTIRNYADTQPNRKKGFTPHKPVSKSKDAGIDESQSFLAGHIYPQIKKHMTREFTDNELYALCIAGYQLEGHLPTICKQLSAATTPQEIADAFITPTMYNYGGTPKRRWICAMLAAGYITIEDILNADIDAFYAPDINTFIRNGSFVCNEATIQYVMGLKRNGTTRAVVEELKDGRLALAQLEAGGATRTKTIDFSKPTKEDLKITESMEYMIDAQHEYDAKNYEIAAELFQNAINVDPDNMEAYSSLALAYVRLGQKYTSVEYYQKAAETVVACNLRMNANRALLMDFAVKGSSYYNAGLARESMADIYKEQGNKTETTRNYKLALKNYKNARDNYENLDGYEYRKEVYKKAIERIENAINGKDTSKNSNNSKVFDFHDAGIKVASKKQDKKKLNTFAMSKESMEKI